MAGLKYDQITRYKITAICEGPLHIGSAIGGKEEVLIDPIENRPFIQASSISGVFRAYCKDLLKDNRWEQLFGSNSVENMSRIRFEDGYFDKNCKMEYRPHVSINKATGSVSSKKIKGSNSSSGQKFNMEYVGAGSEIAFYMYLYEDSSSNDNLAELTNTILSAMNAGVLQFGGKKSNGSGVVRLTSLKKKIYELRKESDRAAWRKLDDKDLVEATNELKQVVNEKLAYEVIVEGSTENYIQIKGLAVSGTGKNAPDSQNIQNALKEYIIPGSSLKGAFRSQMEKISDYLGCADVIIASYGKAAEASKTGEPGNLIFSDTVIGDIESNDKMPIEHRIHIDKFTGGVIEKGLYSEKNAAGNLRFSIKILDRNKPQRTLGLLLFALRDLAIGIMSLGSGYNTGKGIVDISKISVKSVKLQQSSTITYEKGNGKTIDEADLFKDALKSLKGCE